MFENKAYRTGQVFAGGLRSGSVNQRECVVAEFGKLQRMRKTVLHCPNVCEASSGIAHGEFRIWDSLEEEQPGVTFIGVWLPLFLGIDVEEYRFASLRVISEIICYLHGLVRVDVVVPHKA